MPLKVLVIDGSGGTSRRFREAAARLQTREQIAVMVQTCADDAGAVQRHLSATAWNLTIVTSPALPFPRTPSAGRIFIAPAQTFRQESQIGWLPSYSGIDVLCWLQRGASGVIDLRDVSGATLARLLGNLPSPIRLILGEGPVQALDDLHTEMTDSWEGRLDRLEPRRRLIWRCAFALAQVAPLDHSLTSWVAIADELVSRVEWFAHNRDDVRKAIGKLGGAWECEAKARRPLLAVEARRRGFPAQPPRDEKFDRLLEWAEDLDVSGQTRVSGFDADYRELVLST